MPAPINDLYEWFCANKLALKASKTKDIVINPKTAIHNLMQFNVSVSIAAISLTRTDINCNDLATKFLGIYIYIY